MFILVFLIFLAIAWRPLVWLTGKLLGAIVVIAVAGWLINFLTGGFH
jgi:hypothetical protein